MDVDEGSEEGHASSRTFSPNTNQSSSRRNSRAEGHEEPHHSTSAISGHSPDDEPLALRESRRHSDDEIHHSASTALRPEVIPGTRPYSETPIPLTHDEAVLVHHYTEHLGRWLDCTDATRQFTLGVPGKVKTCPVLCYAVLSFAARHRKEEATAEAAYRRCIPLLIDRLNEDTATHDETLLCAIVILRFYEQLTGEWASSSAGTLTDHIQYPLIQDPMKSSILQVPQPFCGLLKGTILWILRRQLFARLHSGSTCASVFTMQQSTSQRPS
jgi:hypothetical protein